jgi:tRNA(Ile2) C34 agmatinyltransferase TiaS
MIIYVCIDDTDNQESIGTGRLSRMLAQDLQAKGLIEGASVTRHQLLVHPDIPYTSHNSSACIEAVTGAESDIEKVAARARAFILENFHEGANPGLCIAGKERVPEALRTLGARAQQEVIALEDARGLAEKASASTWWAGETGQGVIGAMAGVGLRATGNDGRFIGLAGIRKLEGVLSVADILSHSGVKRVETVSGEALHAEELVDTQDWVRPVLLNDLPVLVVRRNGSHWQPADERKREH